jgi:hypothetical protein
MIGMDMRTQEIGMKMRTSVIGAVVINIINFINRVLNSGLFDWILNELLSSLADQE